MKRLALAVVCLVPMFSFAQAKPAEARAADYLNESELLDMCADGLPKQLECKAEFCDAMVDIRKKHQAKFAKVDKKELVAGCLKEIAVDGTGETKVRRDRCAGWFKGQPAQKMLRTDADAQKACFTKGTCAEKIACWAPFSDKQMAK